MSNWVARQFIEDPSKVRITCDACGRNLWVPPSASSRKTCGAECDRKRRAAVAAEQRRLSAMRPKVPLTAERLREVLDYDPSSGAFRWRAFKGSKAPAGSVAGHWRAELGYVMIGVDGTRHWAHRLAWLHVHGTWPPAGLDHINRRKGDNRMANLREAGPSLNSLNVVAPRAGRKHQLPLGVYVSGRKYYAKIMVDRRTRHLGMFETPQEASAAYVRAKAEIQAEGAVR